MIFFLRRTACFSILSMQRVSAWYMSALVSLAVSVCSRQCRRISAMCRFLTTSMMTCACAVEAFSNRCPIFPKCSSTCARRAGVTSMCRPVYSKSIPDLSAGARLRGGRGPLTCPAPSARALALLCTAKPSGVGRQFRACLDDIRRPSHDRLALARARNLHLVAVLRNGAARQLDALPGQNLDDLVVRDGVVRVLLLDQLLDPKLNDAGRDLLALLVEHALGEEAPQLDDALRRVRVLAVDDARDGREVHPRVLGHVLEHHRPDELDALVEELALAADDALDDAVDGLAAVLDVAQQIDRRAHLLLDEVLGLLGRPITAEHVLHVAADAQARAAVVGEIYLVDVVHLLDKDLGDDQDGLVRGVAPARVRVEHAYVLKLLDQLDDLDAHLLGEVRQLVLLKFRERMLADQARGQTLLRAARAHVVAERIELDEQAFTRVARATADGVEVEDNLPRLLDTLDRATGEFRHLFVGRVQAAVAVEIADDALADRDEVCGGLRHVELPLQVLRERGRARQELLEGRRVLPVLELLRLVAGVEVVLKLASEVYLLEGVAGVLAR